MVLERPKVLRNPQTGKFVMWMHIDSGDYELARLGVAVSDNPHGPFRYQGSFRPHGQQSRDFTVFAVRLLSCPKQVPLFCKRSIAEYTDVMCCCMQSALCKFLYPNKLMVLSYIIACSTVVLWSRCCVAIDALCSRFTSKHGMK